MYFLPVLVMIVAYTIISFKLITRKIPGTFINSTISAQERAKRKVGWPHTPSFAFYECIVPMGFLARENPPQWGAEDAEIKVRSGENTELKRSPFKAWSRSVYSHTCYAYC